MALETVDCDGSSFCCLGVLCKVAQENGVPVISGRACVNGQSVPKISGVSLAYQPTVVQWLELPPEEINEMHTPLVNMNDIAGDPFTVIADYLEKIYVKDAA